MNKIFDGDNRIETQYGVFGPASGRNHAGVDIDTSGDPTIHSTVAGKVKWAREVAKGAPGWGNTWEWGWFVWIVAEDGSEHIFAHCKPSSLKVREGELIRAGQALAVMGKSGNAAFDRQAEHVHYEVRVKGRAVDPSRWAGIPNKAGTYQNNNTIEKSEDDNMKLGIYQAQMTKKPNFEELKNGMAYKTAEGLRVFERRMARECDEKSFDAVFAAMEKEAQNGEIMMLTEN
jgi:hypothetical protein